MKKSTEKIMKSIRQYEQNLIKKQSPKCCKHVFRNFDGWLMCDLYDAEQDYNRDRCVNGQGRCKNRVNRWKVEK